MNHPLPPVQYCPAEWSVPILFFFYFIAFSRCQISQNKILLSISESAGSEQIWTMCLYLPINNVNNDKKITSHVNGSWPRSKDTYIHFNVNRLLQNCAGEKNQIRDEDEDKSIGYKYV